MPKFSGINRPYNTSPIEKTPEEKQKELDARMKEFLAKGGKVEKVKPRITKEMLEKWKI